jgi:hypothetical protein
MRSAGVVILLALFGCDRKEHQPVSAASASASAPAPGIEAGPPKNEWAGSYTSRAATIFVPDGGEWSGVKFRGEDAGDGLGDGTLRIVLSPGGGVSGEGDGALGAFTIAGGASENVITFSVRRKDPSDMGFTGTGRATLEQDKLEGSMRVSKATGNVIREATFSLHR